MNGYRVGTFTKTTSGAHQFQYHESWLAQPGSRPISLSVNADRKLIHSG
ncbi:HipA N-terminal domain-containing protein [Aeromonas caviae]|nr:HipA N-terminal domain-containing protein [Aeromonas caviae]MDH1997496.1 HipA N-terminal domain-containing protein [Aeromonas caviae]